MAWKFSCWFCYLKNWTVAHHEQQDTNLNCEQIISSLISALQAKQNTHVQELQKNNNNNHLGMFIYRSHRLKQYVNTSRCISKRARQQKSYICHIWNTKHRNNLFGKQSAFSHTKSYRPHWFHCIKQAPASIYHLVIARGQENGTYLQCEKLYIEKHM